jgi:hydrogenase 3 maturation protease
MPSRSLLKSLHQALEAQPKSPARRRVVIVGVGSSLRSDDIAGIRIAERLHELALAGVHTVVGHTAPENVTGEIRRFAPSHVLFVDAADFGAAPGVVRVFESADIGGMTSSTHTLPLHVIADYLEKETGCRVIFLGVQPKSVAFGETVSAEVAAAIEETVAAIAEALS